MITPQAHLSVQKSRVKKYSDIYYLENNTEFEIELFNSTTNTICAYVTLNGKSQSAGLVLKPGMNFFLDRFFDSDKKFKFDTYEVDGENTNVKSAIKNNGEILIEFYEEKSPEIIRPNFNNYFNSSILSTYHNTPIYRNTTAGGYYSSINSVTNNPSSYTTTTTNISNILETGRIEEGTISDQKFDISNLKFKSFPSYTLKFKILPISLNKIEKGEVVMYCCDCGRKARKKERFCPKCSNDLIQQRNFLD